MVLKRNQFPSGTWEGVQIPGRKVADKVSAAMVENLEPIEPSLLCQSVEMVFSLENPLGEKGDQGMIEQLDTHSESMPEVQVAWAKGIEEKISSAISTLMFEGIN